MTFETSRSIQRRQAIMAGKDMPDFSGQDTTPPIGWTIESIGDNGSVLCKSPTGEKRRYVFEPKNQNEFICDRCSLRQDAKPKVEPGF